MEPIIIKNLKPGDLILAYDSSFLTWVKCKIIQIEKYLITLEEIEGSLKGIPWYETLEALKDPDYYRMTG